MPESPQPNDRTGSSGRLTRTRAATTAAMMIERGWPLVLPLVVVASLFVSLSWFGAFRVMPDAVRFGVLALFGLASLAALVPLFAYRQPSRAEIDRRIESSNALEHTPLLVQADRPMGSQDAFSDALWREHQRRMADRLAGVSGDLPRTRVPERDPFALRAVAALLLVVAFAFSFGTRGGALFDGFQARPAAEAVPPRIDAWVTPPAYTGRPPVFLTAEGNAATALFTVPEGSDVTLRVTGGATALASTGGSGDERLQFSDAGGTVTEMNQADPGAVPTATAPKAGTAALQFAGKLSGDGVLALMSGEQAVRSWTFSVTPDAAPVIRFTAEPRSAVNGTLELEYEIVDDYGASSAKADFMLDAAPAPGALPLYEAPEMPLSLPRRGAKDAPVKATRDLTEHVWAGATVQLTLTAADDAGQEAKSETKTFVLPERPFTNPLARAIVDLRRIFSLDANRKPYVLDLIDAITLRPEDTLDQHVPLSRPDGRSHQARDRRQRRRAARQRRTISGRWRCRSRTATCPMPRRRLRQAQEALKQALRDGASDEEIDKRMAELREAMNEFLREFAERAAQRPQHGHAEPAATARRCARAISSG